MVEGLGVLEKVVFVCFSSCVLRPYPVRQPCMSSRSSQNLHEFSTAHYSDALTALCNNVSGRD